MRSKGVFSPYFIPGHEALADVHCRRCEVPAQRTPPSYVSPIIALGACFGRVGRANALKFFETPDRQ